MSKKSKHVCPTPAQRTAFPYMDLCDVSIHDSPADQAQAVLDQRLADLSDNCDGYYLHWFVQHVFMMLSNYGLTETFGGKIRSEEQIAKECQKREALDKALGTNDPDSTDFERVRQMVGPKMRRRLDRMESLAAGRYYGRGRQTDEGEWEVRRRSGAAGQVTQTQA